MMNHPFPPIQTSKILLALIILLAACTGTQSPIPIDATELPISTLGSKIGLNTEAAPPKVQPTSTTTKHDILAIEISSTPTNEKPVITHAFAQVTNTPRPVSDWKLLPIIPTVSQNARAIYQDGITRGRNPHAFSKVGDCQSITTYFLSYFEQPDFYDLGPYSDLQESIDWFKGSFSRESLAVKGGFNAAAILSPLRADQNLCNPDENPIACEYRVNNPSIALISLEEWWAGDPENYEKYMRQIIEYSIDQGVLPIIATKADNLEGNHLINQTIVKLATEYDIPLWNFWSAVQPLANHGLILKDSNGTPDMFHLTHRNNFFFNNNTTRRQSGWSVRNLTALQVLDSIRNGLMDTP